MKKIFQTHPSRLLLSLLFAIIGGGINAWGVTYELQQVISVEAGGLYVFEQGGHVMINTCSSSALQTTDSYKTTGLEGTETYVWTLETATGGFYMKNVSLNNSPYLKNASSTTVSFDNNKSSIWTFNFQDDNTAIIQNKSNSNRFLGYTNSTSYAYKAYAANNLDSYAHAIKVYQLVEEGGSTAVATTTTIDDSGINNTDVYTSTAAGSLSASVTAGGNAVAGATVTWSSSDTDVATIASDGTVTLVSAGSVTFTASYAGVSGEYQASSATYKMTVTSSAPDYVTLPFEWSGGAKADLLALVGVTANGLGSDYAGSNAPYLVKLDNTGDYIQVKTDSQPDKVTINVKMLGGTTTSSITVQESADGETFTEVQTLNISGTSTSTVLTLETTNNFAATTRYVRLYFTKGSNVGVGAITITKFSTDPSITASDIEIAYDATSGSTSYTINNPVEGGTLSVPNAGNIADWISEITYHDNTLTVYCSANTNTTERSATFTLVYTYNGNETVSKEITVTQAAAPVIYTTIPALFAAATSTATDVNITFGGWVVSAVHNNNAYLTDNQGNGLIIYASGHGFQAGDVLTGTVSCKLQLYRGSVELTELTTSTTGLSVAHNGTLTEQNIAISELSGVNTGALLAYQGLTYNGTALVDANSNTITPYNTLSTYTLESGKAYNVKGIYLQFNETKELLPRTADDFVEVQKQDNSIIMVGPDYTIDVSVSGGGEVNMTSAAASHGTLQSEVVLASTTVDASKYNFANNVLTVHDVTEGGVIVIRYWVEADTEYNAAELLVPIYLKANPIIAYEGVTESTAYRTPYTIDTDLIKGGDITLSSSNTDVATVDNLTITPVAVGSTTITINTAETNIWHAGTATFTLSVEAPEGKETAAPASVVTTTFTDKDLNYDEGGIDWTASTNASSFESSNYARGVQFGAAVGQFTLTATGKNVTKVSMVLSTNGTGNAVQVNVDGESFTTTYGEIDPNNVLSLTSGMNKETVEFTGTAGNAVEITVDDSNKSVYIKSITLYEEADPISVKLNGSGYATFCSEYPLDFSDYETAGYSAWQITGVSGETITFSQITGSIMGGQGILLKGTAGETIKLTSVNSSTTLSGNLLEGTLAPKYVAAEQYYGLSGNEFVKVNAGTVPAGKALLPAGALSGNVKAFTFVFEDDATGINEELRMMNEESSIYKQGSTIVNLAGQMVNGKSVNGKLPKGIYIVNGKKIMVK